jgi:ZIP family zinc transporter
MVFAIAIAAFASTILGGLFALKFRDKLHLVLGFSAGAVIAVAFFDLLPEALELGEGVFDHSSLFAMVAVGFFLYLLLDRLFFFHAHHTHEHSDDHNAQKQGTLSVFALCFHSFLDGVAIGLAFHVSNSVGIIVATAVLVHDFSDGVNTVGLVMRGGGKVKRARMWLLLDALAPILGVASTFLFTIPSAFLGVILSLFAGFFLYIGASDLIPESHHAHPRLLTTVMTLVGALVLFFAIRLAGA